MSLTDVGLAVAVVGVLADSNTVPLFLFLATLIGLGAAVVMGLAFLAHILIRSLSHDS